MIKVNQIIIISTGYFSAFLIVIFCGNIGNGNSLAMNVGNIGTGVSYRGMHWLISSDTR